VRTVLPLRTVKRIQELARQGFLPGKIAEMTGVSETTCKRYSRVARAKNKADAKAHVTEGAGKPKEGKV
jgi:hypothetical protein